MRAVFVVAGGTGLAQVLALLAAPLLTRLYSPEDFGALALFASILGMLIVVASLRYELAIPIARDDDAVGLVALAFAVLGGFSLLTFGVVMSAGDLLARRFDLGSLRGQFWLLPVGLLGAGAYNVLSYWALRERKYGQLAKTRVVQAGGKVGAQVAFGLASGGSIGLLVGEVIGQAAGVLTLGTQFRRAWRTCTQPVNLAVLTELARQYIRFPMLSAGSSLVNAAGLLLPAPILAAMYGPEVLGWFALSQRVVQAPVQVLGASVAQVYISQAATLARKDDAGLRRLYFRTARHLFLLGIGPTVLVGVGGGWLFGIAFGHEWTDAGRYAQVLSLMTLGMFIVSPLSQTLNILERQGIQLVWDVGRTIGVLLVFAVAAVLQLSPIATISVYSLCMSIAYVTLFLLSSYAVHRAHAKPS